MGDYESLSLAFKTFNDRIKVSPTTLNAINARLGKMEVALDKYYYDSEQNNKVIKVGSIGRQTDIHASDVDIIYLVPNSVYSQYNAYSTNGQQSMLYAFRDVLRGVYSSTSIKADGLVAVVSFTDGITFELMPCVVNTDGSYTYPISNAGGSWGKTNPVPEIGTMNYVHSSTNGNARKLARMMRSWKEVNSVNMGGLLIDTYVYRFLQNYTFRDKNYYFYDWMSRDFLEYLSRQNDSASYIYALGSNQNIYLKSGFASKAKAAHKHALDAIQAFSQGYKWTSANHWRSIFGNQFPDFT
jgi:hypothetical protein